MRDKNRTRHLPEGRRNDICDHGLNKRSPSVQDHANRDLKCIATARSLDGNVTLVEPRSRFEDKLLGTRVIWPKITWN